jgi:hypothetical protein
VGIDDGGSIGVSGALIVSLSSDVVVLVPSEELVGGVTESESRDPGTNSNNEAESEVLVSLNNGDGLSGLLGILEFNPHHVGLDVSDEGDGESPGKEEEDGEELVKSEPVSEGRFMGVLVVLAE